MSDNTRIEWTDATWNPVTGCTKVSSGCKFCYAERDWMRLSGNPQTRYFGRRFTDVKVHPEMLEQPLRWKRPRRVFVNSMSDLFHEQAPDKFIADVFGVMASCPQHSFQILTKRPERAVGLLGSAAFIDEVMECMALYSDEGLVWPLSNVWFGVSIEDQNAADQRIPPLLETPCAIRWVSAEPLLGRVDLRLEVNGGIDWVVVGGESGSTSNEIRPMHPDWARSLRDQCVAADAAFLFKQWGEYLHVTQFDKDGLTVPQRNSCGQTKVEDGFRRVGKKLAGSLLDGVAYNSYPDTLVRVETI